MIVVFLCLASAVLGAIGIEWTPPLWWDEGWTLCVARTWVEQGHYGCLLEGKPAAPILSGHFPVVAPIAASFSLFGVGIWQARVVGLTYTLLTFCVLWYVISRLYDHKIATASLVVLLALPLDWYWHPIIMGRQVLGEMPMICFLLAGYACFLHVGRRWVWLGGAALCWGLALMTKAQTLPFWVASMAMSLAILVWRREWPIAFRVALGTAGTVLCWYGLDGMKALWLAGHTASSAHAQAKGLAEAAALSLDLTTRRDALMLVLQNGLPAIIGLAYALWRLLQRLRVTSPLLIAEVVRTMYVMFAISWLGWFVGLSAGMPRYAFLIIVLGGPMLAAAISDWTGRFDIAGAWAKGRTLIRSGRWETGTSRLFVAVVLIAVLGLTSLYRTYLFSRWSDTDRSVVDAAAFLNQSTPAQAKIETYESELFLLLNRPYHYPPAQTNVGLLRRTYHNDPGAARYDWLNADPDYLVIGRFGRWLGQYRELVEQGRIRHVRTIGLYEIYERVRG